MSNTLIADEFSAELAEGLAYVAGHDDESRPVMIFRIKQDYHKFHSQKLFTRLLVFTLEVAVQTMAKNVEQFVLLFDANSTISTKFVGKQTDGLSETFPEIAYTALEVSRSDVRIYRGFFRSASAFMNMLLTTLKIIADYYPARLHRAFVIDPPSLFTYLWKGVKPFVELSPLTSIVSSLDYEDSLEYNNNNDFALYPRAVSMRFDSTAKVGGGSCSSSRFSFTVSTHHVDSLKPWYLSTSSASNSKVGPTNPPSSAAISPHNARSHSFASPRGAIRSIDPAIRKNFFPSTPMPQRTQKLDPSMIRQYPRTPKASFLQSPALFFKRDNNHHYHHQQSRVDKSRESFVPFVNFYRRLYDEMIYRSKMRPPLGGLVSIVSPQVRRRHVSISQRF
ncbi:Sec14p-like phosphatidylinositol transfer family protein [Striga asiatica]|uniref:Sec14p-like phosphatidylinositol transfer family protein n=1 Tax=Striga asiatica TaxID=4170 RepID=A0A5A7QLB5_STRAF|nr:Sec14p-like phosphatidylinositol transfer family protein [Striga asiatica]